ncbi:MAG: hypothetical protein DWQ07_17375 [Chloroflexi bacterium]|nr:MAG: hypothetical protein DWQ07_17375 [Chloroflexota bacterium]MBL1195177.1 hypothetical protein [Chloroflexota bacterium]NOH12460.1 hypothetical protein [Chloroflexota bacterium]
MQLHLPGTSPFQGSCTQVGQVSELISELTLVGIAFVGAFFAIRVFYRLFTGQVNLLAGRSAGIADTLVELFGGTVLMLFAYQAPIVGQRIGAFICQGRWDSSGAVVDLMLDLLVDPLVLLFSSLAVAAVIVVIVFAAFRSQLAVVLQSRSSLAEYVSMAGSAILLFAVVIVAFRVAISLVSS